MVAVPTAIFAAVLVQDDTRTLLMFKYVVVFQTSKLQKLLVFPHCPITTACLPFPVVRLVGFIQNETVNAEFVTPGPALVRLSHEPVPDILRE